MGVIVYESCFKIYARVKWLEWAIASVFKVTYFETVVVVILVEFKNGHDDIAGALGFVGV